MCQRLVVLQQMQPLILVQSPSLQHQRKVLNVTQREAVLQRGYYILEGGRCKQVINSITCQLIICVPLSLKAVSFNCMLCVMKHVNQLSSCRYLHVGMCLG